MTTAHSSEGNCPKSKHLKQNSHLKSYPVYKSDMYKSSTERFSHNSAAKKWSLCNFRFSPRQKSAPLVLGLQTEQEVPQEVHVGLVHRPGHVVLALLPTTHRVEVTGAFSGMELAETAPREVEGGQVGEAEARGGLEKALVLTEEQALLSDLWDG